jgi:hypothetical protein
LLRQALADAGRNGLTYEQIGRIRGLSQHKAKRRLPIWYAANEIGREGAGSKSDPYRWFNLSA